jgi:hypothetical protein
MATPSPLVPGLGERERVESPRERETWEKELLE